MTRTEFILHFSNSLVIDKLSGILKLTESFGRFDDQFISADKTSKRSKYHTSFHAKIKCLCCDELIDTTCSYFATSIYNNDAIVCKICKQKYSVTNNLLYLSARFGRSSALHKKKIHSLSAKRDLKFFINKYGDVDGLKKYESRNTKSDCSSIKFFINKYGEIDGLKKYDDRRVLTSVSKEKFISTHGEIDGLEKYNNWKNNGSMSLYNLQRKHGEELGLIKYEKHCDHLIKLNSSKNTTSKSVKETVFMNKLSEKLQLNLHVSKIISKCIVDAYCEKYNVIIEYNGTYWHQDPRFYTSEKQLQKNNSDIIRYNYQLSIGYRVAVIWEHDDNEKSINRLIEFFQTTEQYFCSANNILNIV